MANTLIPPSRTSSHSTVGVCAGVAEALGQRVAHGGPHGREGGTVQGVRVDQEQADQHRGVGEGVHPEVERAPEQGERDPGHRRAHDAGQVERGAVQGDGLEEILARDDLRHERLADRACRTRW